MVQSQKLPHSLLTELGRVVAIWANIEQDILMQTSALAAKATHGVPSEFLRLDFKRLRETWFRLCRDNFDTKTFNKSVNPINVEIARLAPFRQPFMAHGPPSGAENTISACGNRKPPFKDGKPHTHCPKSGVLFRNRSAWPKESGGSLTLDMAQ
jgi:hypothetical protein